MNSEEKAQEADRDLQRDLAEIAAETEQHKSDNAVEIAAHEAEQQANHTHPELALKDHHHEQFDDHEARIADHHARLSALEDWIMGHGDWHKEVDHVHEDMPDSIEEIAEPAHEDGATHVAVEGGENKQEEKKEPASVRHGLRHRTR